MPNIREIKIGNTTYNVKDDSARTEIANLNSATVRDVSITLSDMTAIGGDDGISTYKPFYTYQGETYVWLRTKRFQVYAGQKISVTTPCHLDFFTTKDFESRYKHLTVSSAQTVTVEQTGYCIVSQIINPASAPSASTVYATVVATKYTEETFWIDEKEGLMDGADQATYGISQAYKQDGTTAAQCDVVRRGVVFPLGGDILYTDRPLQNDTYPICYHMSLGSGDLPVAVTITIERGTKNAVVSVGWGTDSGSYVTYNVVFDAAFQGRLNGLRFVLTSNSSLACSYVYEGELNVRSASIPAILQYIIVRMTRQTGCLIQTGTAPNISYYGRAFDDYDDYFRFVKTLSDDSQIQDHEERIEALEEGGGGGGGTSTTDWEKGLDLLEFGQEYLYAWLNALKTGNGFKVLFTGDSTTAYYNGTENGLKEILKSCMENAGHDEGTYVNRAVSGINSSTWRTTYLAGDIAENPTLYIIRHGFNNEDGETEDEMAEAFRTSMNTALSTIRQQLPVTSTSIILMTPNTSDDNENHRGISMKKKLDPIVRNLAREYGCGFVDTFRLWYDPGVYADPMYDDPFGDHRSIHPNGLMNRIIISKLFDFAVPYAFRDANGGGGGGGGSDLPVTRIRSSVTVASNSTVTIPLPSGVTKDQVRVLHGYIEINNDYQVDEAILVQMVSSSGIQVKNIGNTAGVACVDIALESATSVIRLTTSEMVNMNGTAVLPLPSGVTKDQVRILHGYLKTGGDYYVDQACEIQLVSSSGIQVKNISGAKDYMIVDITLESVTNVVRLTTSEMVNMTGTAVLPLPSGVTKDQISILHGYLKTGGDYYVDQACEILSISSSGITVKNVSGAKDYMIVDIVVPSTLS